MVFPLLIQLTYHFTLSFAIKETKANYSHEHMTDINFDHVLSVLDHLPVACRHPLVFLSGFELD